MAKALSYAVECRIETEDPEKVAKIVDVLTRMGAGMLLDGYEVTIEMASVEYEKLELYDEEGED